MKKIYTIILILIIALIPQKIKAYCDDSEIITLQNLAKNVTVSYTFDEQKEKFVVTFTNLKKELILYDATNQKEYNVYGELVLTDMYYGNNRFDIYAKKNNCIKDVLTSKYIDVPFYNQYYKYDECLDIKDYKYCSKWLNKSITYESWYKNVSKYKEEINENINIKQEKTKVSIGRKILNVINKFYVNYYYIILPVIITILCVIIYIKNKQDSFF